MGLHRLLPVSRRVAFVYVSAVCLLFFIHFKIADEFTFQHVNYYSSLRCRYGCLGRKILATVDKSPDKSARIFAESQDSRNFNSTHARSISLPFNDTKFDIGTREARTKIPPVLLYENATSSIKETHLFKAPPGETSVRRFPQAVIIGFTKCGTRALLEFLSIHPFIRNARNEVHFYDKDENFDKGLDWYKQQMPLSYSNQLTMEKTPAYILTERARDVMHQITPLAKLIVLVRDPVVRLVSQFLLRFRVNAEDDKTPMSIMYANNETGLVDPDLRPVYIGDYQKHIKMWFEKFPENQMLIVNSEVLTRNPLPVLRKVEKFLKIPPLFQQRNIFYNVSSGYYCPRGFEDNALPRCLGRSKGLVHPKLPPNDRKMLYRYYKPLNEKLFKIIGYRIDWTEKEWGKEEE